MARHGRAKPWLWEAASRCLLRGWKARCVPVQKPLLNPAASSPALGSLPAGSLPTCHPHPAAATPLHLPQDGGEDEGEGEGDEGDALVEVPEAGMRKSARTEHVDFKQREEER